MGLGTRETPRRNGPSPRSDRVAKPGPSNQAGRPTAGELERRKTLALDVATELFVTRGYAATSLVDIAKGAGVATRTIYHHFGDKEAMFREVIFAREAEAAVPVPGIEDGDTLFAALVRIADYARAVTFRERSVGLMRLMIAESNRFPEFMRGVANSIFARFRNNLRQMFEELEAAGLVPAGDHGRSSALFADLLLGSSPIMSYTEWSAEPPGGEDTEQRVEMFVRGLYGPAVAARAKTRKAKVTAAA